MLYQMLLASAFVQAYEIRFLNMHFWSYGTHQQVNLTKILKMLKYHVQLKWVLLFWRPGYVLYNISFYRMPFWKDFLYCSTCILMGAKLVLHDHGQYAAELEGALKGPAKACLRWMLRHMAAGIIMGEKVRQDYAGLADPAKLMVVPGAVEDTKDILVNVQREEGKINVLYFSYMSRLKGVYTAFAAAWELLKERDDILMTFAGPMEDEKVKAALEALQDAFPQRVRYLGYVEHPHQRTKIFREADIFIFPTLRDVFGLVLLHAMAEGLPIVASREGTIPEIVQHGINALLVEKGYAQALIEKIQLLADDPQLRQRMGQANRRRYQEHYSVDIYGAHMIKAFEQIGALYAR